MVYSFLVVTRMHDLMVTIGLLFSLVALLATTHMLYADRRWSLCACGAICLALLLVSATMYYGHLLYAFLPVMQKTSLVASTGWLVAVQYSQVGHDDKMNGFGALQSQP